VGRAAKERLVPPWRETADALRRLQNPSGAADQQHVFMNRHAQPLTRDGVAYILTKHASPVIHDRPRLARDRITPHVFRHSCAVALLQSGTDVTVIRDYLGSFQHRDHEPVYLDEPEDEARCATELLGTRWHRTRKRHALEAKAGLAFIPPVPLILS
jgi:hypothetical protein